MLNRHRLDQGVEADADAMPSLPIASRVTSASSRTPPTAIWTIDMVERRVGVDRGHRAGSTLCRLSPSGSRVARITSRAGYAHANRGAARDCAIGGEQRAAVERQLDEPAIGMSFARPRASNTLPSPTASRSHGRSGRLMRVRQRAARHARAAARESAGASRAARHPRNRA